MILTYKPLKLGFLSSSNVKNLQSQILNACKLKSCACMPLALEIMLTSLLRVCINNFISIGPIYYGCPKLLKIGLTPSIWGITFKPQLWLVFGKKFTMQQKFHSLQGEVLAIKACLFDCNKNFIHCKEKSKRTHNLIVIVVSTTSITTTLKIWNQPTGNLSLVELLYTCMN